MTLSRRQLIQLAGGTVTGAALATPALAEDEVPEPIRSLQPGDDSDIAAISLDERRARLVKAQRLMAENGLDALVMASGSTLHYFTGARWGTSERFFGAVLTRTGDPAWVTPAFEAARASEQIQIGTDTRAWQEHESPYEVVASVLRDRGVRAAKIGIEETMPFVFASGIGAAVPAAEILSGTPVTAGCRMIKDAHELAIMQRACEKTVAAHRAVFQSLRPGMAREQVSALSSAAHTQLGMRGGSLVLFGADAAYPHGTTHPQPLREGEVVLIDGGGRFLDYSSDITRTAIFGAPVTDRQRRIWDVVRQAQQAAFAVARPGVECEKVDAAARKVITDAGFGSGYELFTHRLGHGIGMDGHEWTYLVKNNKTKLQPGMCFSNEPGIYIYGELGVRHEDIITITEDGCRNLTRWSGTPEDPAVV